MKDEERFDPRTILPEFDKFLHAKGESFNAVVIGAGALTIMKVLNRNTVDFDVLDPKIPPKILKLADDFRLEMEKKGHKMIKNWLNNGPDGLLVNLAKDWRTRIVPFFKGEAITFHTLGRQELLGDKLWGYCDGRSHDRTAILALKPTSEELLKAAQWVKDQEGNALWPKRVDELTQSLLEELRGK